MALLIELGKILLSSAISVVVMGIWLQRWQNREQYVETRLSELLAEVDYSADLAAKYWRSSTTNPSTEQKIADSDMEAELIARQMRIATMRGNIADLLAPN